MDRWTGPDGNLHLMIFEPFRSLRTHRFLASNGQMLELQRSGSKDCAVAIGFPARFATDDLHYPHHGQLEVISTLL
jgi:hypothetical protein